MSGGLAAVLLFLGTLAAVSVIAALAAALVFGSDPVAQALGPVRATALGVAACALAAFALFLLTNPDPVTWPEPFLAYARRTAVTTGFAAVVWLPVFLATRARLAERRA
ncbi:hypothetical protein [Oceaniglobus roseus]|uniref:hypothetical protein n=1 Tax=Oceaniglobus roseus TaxID=1737570 RepID=UPI000C7EDC23|nr:hypothetical protein [Kandeliimicrobium roseum]